MIRELTSEDQDKIMNLAPLIVPRRQNPWVTARLLTQPRHLTGTINLGQFEGDDLIACFSYWRFVFDSYWALGLHTRTDGFRDFITHLIPDLPRVGYAMVSEDSLEWYRAMLPGTTYVEETIPAGGMSRWEGHIVLGGSLVYQEPMCVIRSVR